MTIEELKTEYRDLCARLGENALKKEAIEREDQVIRRRIDELEATHKFIASQAQGTNKE